MKAPLNKLLQYTPRTKTIHYENTKFKDITLVPKNVIRARWVNFNNSAILGLYCEVYKPSSKVCPMSFHLELNFCLIWNWNFTWNDIFLHTFMVNDSIRLFTKSQTNETLLYDIFPFFSCLLSNYSKECCCYDISWHRRFRLFRLLEHGRQGWTIQPLIWLTKVTHSIKSLHYQGIACVLVTASLLLRSKCQYNVYKSVSDNAHKLSPLLCLLFTS